MNNVKALYFDVGGTVFDWKSTAREAVQKLSIRENTAIDSEKFADAWRGEMFKIHSEVRLGNLPWLITDQMHLKALQNMTVDYPLLAKINLESLVKDTWHNMQVFEGASAAINRLRTKYTTVVLTILNWESIVNSSKRGGVQWDGILSCEFLGYYKPSLESYKKGLNLLGLKPEEGMMVAAHKGDLAAARKVGMKTALVEVPEEDNMANFGQSGDESFDIEVDGFPALCESLGV